ncbi:hypothetical protein ACLSYX_03925 [[Pasteurella] aerogenes]
MQKRWWRKTTRSLFWLCCINAIITLPLAYLSLDFAYPNVHEYVEYGWCDVALTAEQCDESITSWRIFFHSFYVIWLCFTIFGLVILSVMSSIGFIVKFITAQHYFSRKNK